MPSNGIDITLVASVKELMNSIQDSGFRKWWVMNWYFVYNRFSLKWIIDMGILWGNSILSFNLINTLWLSDVWNGNFWHSHEIWTLHICRQVNELKFRIQRWLNIQYWTLKSLNMTRNVERYKLLFINGKIVVKTLKKHIDHVPKIHRFSTSVFISNETIQFHISTSQREGINEKALIRQEQNPKRKKKFPQPWIHNNIIQIWRFICFIMEKKEK